jgi:mannose-6-phosphate isomerase-like protein (cupin superfamily)
MDAKSFVTLPGQEPVWNMAPGRTAALKLLNQQTGQSVMAFEELAPAGTETPLHLHHDSDEVMFVLSGEFSFKIGDEFRTGGPGTCAFMPRDIPHAWKNSGTQEGRAFFFYTPGEAGKVFEEMSRRERPVVEAMGDPELAQLFRRYGWEVVGPPPF